MTNKELLEKLQEDIWNLDGFSKYTKYSYYHKGKEIIEYFNKPMEEVNTTELRNFLLKHMKEKRRLPKILSDEELNVFFNACENYEYKTIFMLIYGSGLRIWEATNLRIEDVDSKEMRLFVRNGKGERERYTVLPKASLEMLRK